MSSLLPLPQPQPWSNRHSKQHGIVLLSSLLLLLILTLVALALAQNSRSNTQLAAAGIARSQALQLANGAQEHFLENQRLERGDSVLLTNSGRTYVDDVSLGISNQVDFIIETGCRRSRNATASGVIHCRQSDVQSQVTYGRNDRGRLAVTAGIEQPVLILGGN
ncbi:MAG: pilus assembly protein PilX [Ferrimonas sp.]